MINKTFPLLLMLLYSNRILAFHQIVLQTRFFRHVVSSQPLKSTVEELRLERILSNRGVGSRREVADIIKAGRVMFNGKVIKSPAERLPVDSILTVAGVVINPVPLLLAYNKPLDVLSTIGDPIGRPNLLDNTPKSWTKMGLHPVGRLDADTTGLLLFSSDGKLTQRLLHPSNNVEREYIAKVEGNALRASLRDELAAGIKTSDGTYPAKLVEQTADSVRLVVTEGKYRMVRRILANAGLPVVELHRVRYGAVSLSELGIKAGCWCEVSPQAKAWAQRIVLTGNTSF